ncbi:MAG: VWA domain-containing protein [Myxococcota bacterium]
MLPSSSVLAQALQEHPALTGLPQHARLQPFALPAAQTLALWLLGSPSPQPDALGGLLLTLALPELTALTPFCAGRPLQAALAAGYFVAESLLRAEQMLIPPAKPDFEAETSPELPSAHALATFQAELETLAGRTLPPHFPQFYPPTIQEPTQTGTSDQTGARPQLLTRPQNIAQRGAQLAQALGLEAHGQHTLQRLLEAEAGLEVLSLLLPGLGWDLSTGALHRTLLERLQLLLRLLERLPQLRRMVDDLGRLEGQLRPALKVERGGRETVVGVRVGGELADVLPMELALLADEDTELLFYQRFSEHRLMCLELQGQSALGERQPDRRGPVIACLDTSGSMQGAPEEVAKALLLALARQVVPRGRPVWLVAFSGPGELLELELKRGQLPLEALLTFLAQDFHGGTDFETPLERAQALIETRAYADADVLLVTDGLGGMRAVRQPLFLEAKQRLNFRVISVVIGRELESVRSLSDAIWWVEPERNSSLGLSLRKVLG